MSSIPGYDLESFVAWELDLIVNGDGSANPSRQIAEALGTATQRRKEVSAAEFARTLSPFEPYRETVEWRLLDFDEENQSWRDYASSAFDFIPDEVYATARQTLTP